MPSASTASGPLGAGFFLGAGLLGGSANGSTIAGVVETFGLVVVGGFAGCVAAGGATTGVDDEATVQRGPFTMSVTAGPSVQDSTSSRVPLLRSAPDEITPTI